MHGQEHACQLPLAKLDLCDTKIMHDNLAERSLLNSAAPFHWITGAPDKLLKDSWHVGLEASERTAGVSTYVLCNWNVSAGTALVQASTASTITLQLPSDNTATSFGSPHRYHFF
jgi:hypothetical protein